MFEVSLFETEFSSHFETKRFFSFWNYTFFSYRDKVFWLWDKIFYSLRDRIFFPSFDTKFPSLRQFISSFIKQKLNRVIIKIFRWGRIGNYEEPETNDVPDCDKPWSAFFMKDTKVTVIKTGVNVGKPEKKNKRRSRSIGDRIESTPVRTTDPIR